jgi:hypothetical protein
LGLSSGLPTVREGRIGGQPEPDEQGQGFGCYLGLLIKPSKVSVDAIEATAECGF